MSVEMRLLLTGVHMKKDKWSSTLKMKKQILKTLILTLEASLFESEISAFGISLKL